MAYRRQVRFVADLSVWADSERAFRLPAQTRSMLVRLEGPPEQTFGVVITNPAGTEFAPGVEVAAALLEPWADPGDLPHIEPGLSFNLWYGRNVGAGTVRTVSS